MLSSGFAVAAALFVVGLLWVREVLGRLSRDVAELRQGDATDRTVIVIIWMLTAGILAWMVRLAVRVVAGIAQAF